MRAFYAFRVAPDGEADPGSGPDGPLSAADAARRDTSPDPVTGWRTLITEALPAGGQHGRPVKTARELITGHFARTGQRDARGLDAAYAYQWEVLRGILTLLDVILEDEGVPAVTAERVMRCLLYGAPNEADAGWRMRHDEEMKELLAQLPPLPVPAPPVPWRSGMPPRRRRP